MATTKQDDKDMSKAKAMTKEQAREAKRQELVARVKEAEANLETRSKRMQAGLHKARVSTSAFVVRHPLTSLTGGILLGVAIGTLIPRPHRRPSGAALARMAGEYGRAYLDEARRLAERGVKAGREALEDWQEESEDLREAAAGEAAELADEASKFSRAAGKSAARMIRNLR